MTPDTEQYDIIGRTMVNCKMYKTRIWEGGEGNGFHLAISEEGNPKFHMGGSTETMKDAIQLNERLLNKIRTEQGETK